MEIVWASLGSLAPGLDSLRSLGKDNFVNLERAERPPGSSWYIDHTSGSGQEVLGMHMWLLPLSCCKAWCGCSLPAKLPCDLGTPFPPPYPLL